MAKVVVRIVLGLLALVLLLAGFLVLVATTPWGQEFVTKQVNSYLAQKLKSPFHIGRVRYSIPDWIELENVFFKTPQGDTLINGGRMRLDIDMMGLLDNQVGINQVELERIRLNITRTLPDTASISSISLMPRYQYNNARTGRHGLDAHGDQPDGHCSERRSHYV